MKLLYLDFDGVLHDQVFHDGCEQFEWMPILEELLAPYRREVKIVLSTSWVWAHDVDYAKAKLSPMLQGMVIGATYDGVRIARYTFFELLRGQQIAADVLWRRPQAWFAIDDDTIDWPDLYRDNLVATDSNVGISDPAVQEAIQMKLKGFER